MLSETNLTADISNAEVGLLNHKIYRKDRSNETSDRVRGGGKIVAVDKDIPSFKVSVSTNPIECFMLISWSWFQNVNKWYIHTTVTTTSHVPGLL